MSQILGTAFILALLTGACPSAFSQLRRISPYTQDRINNEHTFFILKDADTAGFGWASEWTQMTVNVYEEKSVVFVWHFKDGTKAYSRQGDHVGDAGMYTSWMPTNESQNLENARREKVQPATRANYPVKVELWIGEAENDTGFKPEFLVDTACFKVQNLEYGRRYNSSECAEKSAEENR
jgi:hypothetical protein